MATMTRAAFPADSVSGGQALDGNQALDGAWPLDGAGFTLGAMVRATNAMAAMSKGTKATATMTGA